MDARLLGTALVVVLAGCSLAGGGGPATTATPAEVPDPNASRPGTAPSPPGINDGAVVDVGALVDAQEDALSGESYVWRKRVVARGVNGTRQVEQTVRAAVANETYFRYDRRTVGTLASNETFAVYADGSRQYFRIDDNTSSVKYESTAITGWILDNRNIVLESRLAETNATVDRIETPRGPRFRIESTPASRNVTLSATVRPDGLIEDLSTTVRVDDGTVTFRSSISLGPVPVDPPEWFPNATSAQGS